MAESTYEGWTIRLERDRSGFPFPWVVCTYVPGATYVPAEWFTYEWMTVVSWRWLAIRRAKRHIRKVQKPTPAHEPEIIRL